MVIILSGDTHGLAEFIVKCETPMTIAIQGDWGSGKTSAMHALKDRLHKKGGYWQIDFNTWQYAQLDLGDQLVFSLLGTILVALESKIPKDKKEVRHRVHEIARKVARVSKGMFLGASRTLVEKRVPYGDVVINAMHDGIEEYKRISDTEKDETFGPDDSIKLIMDLRKNLEEVVKDIINSPNQSSNQAPKRIVIYIDDLDRLNPERAVMVMEAIKVFLDIPDCVFVLAIDFAVVLRGVREKYGQDFSEDKVRAFF